jgi:hypothetical protein
MDWIPAISTTSVLGVTIWLGRDILIQRLRGSIQHEFNGKLEKLRADMRDKESQIEALRSGALSGVQYRQAALYDRKLKATEDIWNAVVSMAVAKNVSAFIATIKFDEAAKEAAQNEQIREAFKAMGDAFDLKALDLSGASKSRPYVSKLAWAYYSAYQSIVMRAVLQMEMLKAGIDIDLSKKEEVLNLIKVALPHHEGYIEKYGLGASHYLLEELELKILAQIENTLKGVENDQESLEKAARILREADSLMEANGKSKQGS